MIVDFFPVFDLLYRTADYWANSSITVSGHPAAMV